MEGSLCYLPSAPDLRDLYRRGSGLTPRRLDVLIRALPAEAPLWAVLREEEEKANRATPDKIRSRQAEWERRNAERLARETADG